MMTIKEIARLAGVSRGTVDRVLNNRGAVNPETEKKIKAIAKAADYRPSRAGKTLAVTKKKLRFGFILFASTESNLFFLDIVSGIENRKKILKDYGAEVELRHAEIDNPDLQLKLINELTESGVDGLAITPINHPVVAGRLKELTCGGFPVVTVNSDIPDCGRIAYVGSDYRKGGETAAGLMNLICRGSAEIGIVIGSPWVLCHSERAAAFSDYVRAFYPRLHIVNTVINHDDDKESFAVTKDMLAAHTEIDALYLASAGVQGACRAVEELGLGGKIKIICYDITAPIRALIQSGFIVASIAQQPFTQGAKSLDILLDYLGLGLKPEKECFYTKTEIKIKENL